MQAAVSPPTLTELEGAILTEIIHRGDQTAFRVRRSFAVSPSLEWRGSAGSVYGAIAKLEKAGLIAGTRTGDGRNTRLLSATPAGKAAMLAWACDAERATSVGIDPFRLRAGIWAGLNDAGRTAMLNELRVTIEANLVALRAFSRNDDGIERASVELAVRLQEARLAWVMATAEGKVG